MTKVQHTTVGPPIRRQNGGEKNQAQGLEERTGNAGACC